MPPGKRKGGRKTRGTAGTGASSGGGSGLAPPGSALARGSDEDGDDDDDEEDGKASQKLDADGQARELLEQLTEKRASRRVDALVRLRALLQRNVLGAFCASQQAALGAALLACVRRGTIAEAVPACAALALAVLTLAERGASLYRDARDTLVRLVRDPKAKEHARAAAAEALATACFVTDTGEVDADTDELLDLYFSLYDLAEVAGNADADTGVVSDGDEDGGGVDGGAGGGADSDADAGDDDEPDSADEEADSADAPMIGLVEAAVRSWGLLVSGLPARRRAALYLAAGPALRLVLENRALGARVAAGSVLAMLRVAHDAQAPESTTEEFDAEELAQKLRSMATENSRRRAKRERREQRAVFRSVLATFEDGGQPSEELTLQHDRFEFAGWIAGLRLAALRRLLGGGLNAHFLHNELLSAIFNVRAHAGARPDLAKSELKVRKEDQIWEAQQRARDRADHDKKARKKKLSHTLPNDEDDM